MFLLQVPYTLHFCHLASWIILSCAKGLDILDFWVRNESYTLPDLARYKSHPTWSKIPWTRFYSSDWPFDANTITIRGKFCVTICYGSKPNQSYFVWFPETWSRKTSPTGQTHLVTFLSVPIESDRRCTLRFRANQRIRLYHNPYDQSAPPVSVFTVSRNSG